MSLLSIRNVRFGLGEGPTLLRSIHQLRYAVYVKEFGFFNPVHHPSGLLADDFDGMGLHAVATQGEEVVAALRLALHSERGFPMQGVVPRLKVPTPPERTGELSHLVIHKNFRRRDGDGLYGAESYLKVAEGGVLPADGRLPKRMKRRRAPVLALGLFRVLYQTSRRLGLEAWLMLAEKKLHLLLNHYSLPFRQVAEPLGGPEGPRPCLLTFKEMESRLARLEPDLYKDFLSGLEREYRP